MGGAGKTSTALTTLAFVGQALNISVSFIIFSFLDVLDVVLCVVYKLIDYLVEAEWKPCYCSASKNSIAGGGAIVVAKSAGPKVVTLCSTRLQLEDVSDTLYARPSVLKEITSTSPELCTTTFTVSSDIAEMIKGKIGRHRPRSDPSWSDCDCKTCNSWSSTAPTASHLYVHAEEPKAATEDVVFIHGFISSSAFWTETVFPVFSEEIKSNYRLLAVDLLGFGRSPKPADSLYTLREHVEMIEKSVFRRYNVKSFHIVAHSLGSVFALALAVKYPDAIKSLTLLAPPYFPVPKGMERVATQYVMRRVAPRRVWPAIAFGASMACWYEHVSRTICLTICKHHRVWDSLFKFLTRNRMRTYLIDSFMCHTHNAAWHTLHNIICGSATKMENYLDIVRDRLSCNITVFHGQNDELLPVDCSYAFGSKIPRARVKVFEKKDHITIIIGQERVFAKELEEIWKNTRD